MNDSYAKRWLPSSTGVSCSTEVVEEEEEEEDDDEKWIVVYFLLAC